MDKATELLAKLIDYLEREKGFPKDVLVHDFNISKKYRADLVAIDPETNDPIAIFELKERFDKDKLFEPLKTFQKYKEALDIPDISIFIVSLNDVGNLLVLHIIDEKLSISIPELIPDYETLKNKNAASNKTRIQSNRASTVDNFKWSCYILALILFVILILDITDTYIFTNQQLTILGVIVALILIPYAAKLKILGIEFERFESDKKS